jgi:hypothetical protein
MPAYRFIPALGVALMISMAAWAQLPAPAAPGAPAQGAIPAIAPAPPTPAETTIDEAVKKLKAVKLVSAELVQSVEMLGQSFKVKGQYLRAPGHRSKLMLTLVGLGDAKGRMQQICDGQTLWDFSQVLDSQSCRKFLVQPVLQRLESPDCDALLRDGMMSQLGFAGPDALLTGLRNACLFNQRDEGSFKAEGGADKKIFILRGEWKDRAALTGPGQPPINPIGALPPYVPSVVEVWIGQDDGWPYRVQLAGKPMVGPTTMQQQIGPDGRPIGAKIPVQKEKPSKIILIYSNVDLQPKLTDADFAFQPPQGVQPQDGTQGLTAFLDQQLADRANKRKADANATSGVILDQAIPVPKVPAEGRAPLAPPK